MIRGTTPTLEFKLPFSTDAISVLSIAFAQDNAVVLEKAINEVEMEADTVRVKLSQLDTLKFRHASVEIQMRCKTKDGNVLASKIIKTSAERILKDGEI